jgi:peptidoglycan/xylan/chitin deacetylase (PgdA/CDA1 family)
MLTRHLKRALRTALTSRPASYLLAPLTRGTAAILMLHRFSDAERGNSGHDPRKLRTLLQRLRRKRYNLLPVHDVLARLAFGDTSLAKTVAFTLDDGFADQADVAAPIFAEFDCPATIFVTTGFLDGRLWFWWDRIEHIFHSVQHTRISIEVPDGRRDYRLAARDARDRASVDFVQLCKALPDADKHELIRSLANTAEVTLPDKPPPPYAPMSWEKLRALESQGISFGPHTVTHPVLSRVDGAQARYELTTSWERLRAEARAPVAVFCYPNGRDADFTEREATHLRSLGFLGALSTMPGCAAVPPSGNWDDVRFRIPRYAYDDDLSATLQYVNGLERAKQKVWRSSRNRSTQSWL